MAYKFQRQGNKRVFTFFKVKTLFSHVLCSCSGHGVRAGLSEINDIGREMKYEA